MMQVAKLLEEIAETLSVRSGWNVGTIRHIQSQDPESVILTLTQSNQTFVLSIREY